MKAVLAMIVALGFLNFTHAEESTAEKANAKANDMKRTVKKKGHRVEEMVCAEGDAKCLAKKAGHRGQEGTDYAKDKAKETTDKVDSDAKPR